MNARNQRNDTAPDGNQPKRVKKECCYGEKCYRRNPAHFREFCHPHLEAILDVYSGTGPYNIPDKYSMDQVTIEEQLDVIVEKQLYTPWVKDRSSGNPGERNIGSSDGATSSTRNNQPTTSNVKTTTTTTNLQESEENKPLRGILKNVTRTFTFSSPVSTVGEQNLASLQGSQNPLQTPQRSQNTKTRKRPRSPELEDQNLTTTGQGLRDSVAPDGSPMTPQMLKYSKNIQLRNSSNPKRFKKSTSPEGRNLLTTQETQNTSPTPQGKQTRRGLRNSATAQNLQEKTLTTITQELSNLAPEVSENSMTPQMLKYAKIIQARNSSSPKKSKKSISPQRVPDLSTSQETQNLSPIPEGSKSHQESQNLSTPQKLQKKKSTKTTQGLSDSVTLDVLQIPMTPEMLRLSKNIQSRNSSSSKKSKKSISPQGVPNLSTSQESQDSSPLPQGSKTRQGSRNLSTPQKNVVQEQNLTTNTQELCDSVTPEGSQKPMTPDMLHCSKNIQSRNSSSSKKSKKSIPPQGVPNLSTSQESQDSSPLPQGSKTRQGSRNLSTSQKNVTQEQNLTPQKNVVQEQNLTSNTRKLLDSVTPEGSQKPMTPDMLHYLKIIESQNSSSSKKSKKSISPQGLPDLPTSQESQNLSPTPQGSNILQGSRNSSSSKKSKKSTPPQGLSNLSAPQESQNSSSTPQGSETCQGSRNSPAPHKLQEQNLATNTSLEGSHGPMTPDMLHYLNIIQSRKSSSPKKSKKPISPQRILDLPTSQESQDSSPTPEESKTRQGSRNSPTQQKLRKKRSTKTTQELSDSVTLEGSQTPMTPDMLYYSKKIQSRNSSSSKKSKKSISPEGLPDLPTTSTQVLSNLSAPQGSQISSTPQGSQTTLYPVFNISPTKQVPKEQPNPQGVRTLRNEEESRSTSTVDGQSSSRQNSSDYCPIVPPTRRVEAFLNVVAPKGKMAAKHAASAPFHLFYTTITAARETHTQPYSITFQEILDSSLGELKCSLQINFMVELGWLLAQYYFAGYSAKKLTILYGEDSPDLQTISQKKPNVDAHRVRMASPFGTHHTKMMILCYEDGSLRVVISTANLYIDDWENRVQGLWFSPKCPELPATAMPHDGDSPTMFKKSLLRYLNDYHLPALTPYIERVKRCDFSNINVFLVASVPGGHFDMDWGLTRMGSLLRQHCNIPAAESKQWPLIAQASSLGSYGKDPSVWLTSDFQHNFCKLKEQPQTLFSPPPLKLIYPSLENVRGSHDDLLGGGCLPYGANVHSKQPWLNNFLYQWRATSTNRNRAMPHIKSYTRTSPDNSYAAYFLLTSANCSKAAWGSVNKGNAALRIMSYEAGVLFLPTFVINKDLFPLHPKSKNRLVLPYDVPPVKYTPDMSPWVSDYLM